MSLISSDTKRLLAMSMLKGIGPASLKKAIQLPGFAELSTDLLRSALPAFAKALPDDAAWDQAQAEAEAQVAMALKHGARIISVCDVEYPQLLAQTKDDPIILFVKGKLAPHPENSVAIIGTREPTSHGVLIAQRITQFFVEKKWSVVSGLALGSDGVAHQAALDAGGHTVAVLAHGLQMVAPSHHRKLAQDILDSGGALVSEYPFGRGVIGAQYVKRDRTQAGMAQGVVMIQSDIKGGSLYASRAALDYERWLAIPYPTEKDRAREEPKIQANLLIADGSDAERAGLLRCTPDALARVKILHGREDYLRLTGDDCGEISSPYPPFTPREAPTFELTASRPSYQGDLLDEADQSPRSELPGSATSNDVGAPEISDVEPITKQRYVIYLIPELSSDAHLFGSLHVVAPEFVGPPPDVAFAPVSLLDRLLYVRAKLAEIAKLRPIWEQVSEDCPRGHLQLRLGDVLVHMKRVVDALANGEPKPQTASTPEDESKDGIGEVMKRLVLHLPDSVMLEMPSAVDEKRNSAVECLLLDDVVQSFNAMVVKHMDNAVC